MHNIIGPFTLISTNYLERSEVDPGSLCESVHIRLDLSQTRLDRSQFAFQHLHSDRLT